MLRLKVAVLRRTNPRLRSDRADRAGLAAALALLARERAEVRPVFQLLTYPMLDDRTATRTDIEVVPLNRTS